MKIADIIKYEGDNSTFIWKHPCEDFNSLTQLVVHESQEAIFFMNGQALDLFGPGRYTLDTENIPKIGKLLNKTTGGKTPFHCEVYFINKTVQMAIKWGTDTKVHFIDPQFGIPLEIGACGEMNLSVYDSRKLLVKLVGTMNGIAWANEGGNFTKSLQSSFRPLISTSVKTCLASTIKSENINILEVDENIGKLSSAVHKQILSGFEEYGLTIPEFYVTTIVLPENDPNFKHMKDLYSVSLQTKIAQAEADIVAARRGVELERQTTETEIEKRRAERELIRAQADAQAVKMAGFAEAEVMQAKGYSQKDVLQADVQKAYAEGIGNMSINGGGAGDIVGLGVGIAAAGTIVPQIGEMFKSVETKAPVENANTAKCSKCGTELPANAKFCLECGEKNVSDGMIICPGCNKTVVKGKFCPECGYKFITICKDCGADITAGAKFCLNCGKKTEE